MKSSIIYAILATFGLILIQSNTKVIVAQTYPHHEISVVDTNLILPPAWAFGILYGGYTNQVQTIKRIKEIIAHDYPIDAYWIDSWFWSFKDSGIGPHKYLDFVADTISYPDREQMWDFMENHNIKAGFWVWDCILKEGNEETFIDFDEKGYFSSTYVNRNPWHNKSVSTALNQDSKGHPGTLCGNIDFDNPEAASYFKSKMKHFFDEGADFIKLDRTSKISVCKAMFETTQHFGKETKGRGFILSHTGGTDNEEYKRYPAKWTDDTRSDWTVEQPTKDFNSWVPKVAFKENISMYTDPFKKTSQIPFLTNDLGGFDMGITDILDEELYIRWMQFSLLLPITEVFSQPENPSSNLAWLYSSKADSLFRLYSHLKMMLFPYFYTYAHVARLYGNQMIRKIDGKLYEYMLGNEFLVAPIYEKGATSRNIYFPEGRWINYWTGDVVEGAKESIIAAPIEQIPLFVKEGAIIPMRKYASSIEKGNNDTILLNIYNGSNGNFSLIEDDGVSNDYLKGSYAITKIHYVTEGGQKMLIIEPVVGAYNGMKKNRNWEIYLYYNGPIKNILINNKPTHFNRFKKGYMISFSSFKNKEYRIVIKHK